MATFIVSSRTPEDRLDQRRPSLRGGGTRRLKLNSGLYTGQEESHAYDTFHP